jgi:hypothetical protein
MESDLERSQVVKARPVLAVPEWVSQDGLAQE